MLTYRCPVTKQPVATSIETTESELRRLGPLRVSLWCPHCHVPHSVPARETFLGEEV